MTSKFPSLEGVVRTYHDQADALAHLWRDRARVVAMVGGRYEGLSAPELEVRLRDVGTETGLWAVLVLVASFEATVRDDVELRKQQRSHKALSQALRQLAKAHPKGMRLDDIRAVWESFGTVKLSRKGDVSRLFKHRHWLARGRHWTNKQGNTPSPEGARLVLDEYTKAFQAVAGDFPLTDR